jgi:cation:H+ antiporter
MIVLWLKFIVSAAIVVLAGYKLCIYAEEIARITKLGRTFIGLILLSVVTSLPELAVTVSATKIGALDLALGDLFGSNLFNLTIVGIILLVFVKSPKQLSFDSTHFVSAGISILLITLAAIGITFYTVVSPVAGYSSIFLDVETVLILAVYILGACLIFRSERIKTSAVGSFKPAKRKNTFTIWLRFLSYSVVLVSFAVYLSRLGDEIARIPIGAVPLGGTFVGTLFIAITTSLPEATVAFSAVKLGFWDMALGNIFGSNMFNLSIIPIMDLLLGRKIALSCVSSMHLFTALFVVISTALVICSLVYRSKRKAPALAWDSLSIIFVYFAANLVNFYLR